MIQIKNQKKKQKNKIKIFFFCFCCCVSFLAGIQQESKIIQHFIGGIKDIGNVQDVFAQNNIQNSNLPLSNFKVVIDAGHGGSDPGTLAPRTGKYEVDLNLEISYKLKAAMEQKGATVIMTRTSKNTKLLGNSRKLTMDERGDVIEKAKADMVLSIHQNFNEDSSTIRGTQILVRDEKSVKLARQLQNAFNNELNANLNYIMDEYAVLSYGNQPSVIIECGFLSNIEEEQLLQNEEYQERLVNVIVQEVEEYFK